MSETDKLPNPINLFLGISQRNPNHYDLLGIELFTNDPKVIREAAAKQNGKLLGWQNSDEHHKDARNLMMAIAVAQSVLINPEEKAAYDRDLIDSTKGTEPENPTRRTSDIDRHFLKVAWGLVAFVFISALVLILILPDVKELRENESLAFAPPPVKEDDSKNTPTVESTPSRSISNQERSAALIVDDTNAMLAQEGANQAQENGEKNLKTDDFEPNPDDDEAPEFFTALPKLTRQPRTIFPLTTNRYLTYTNLKNLTFVGPGEGNINLFNTYKTDGIWGAKDGTLQQVSGKNAAIALVSAENFELLAGADVSGTGGFFFLIGWEGKDGYLVYHYALRTTIHWRIVEIQNGKYLEKTHHFFDNKFRPSGWQPVLLSVNNQKLSWVVGGRVLCANYDIPNYQEGTIIFGTYATQYGPKRLRIKSMTIRPLDNHSEEVPRTQMEPEFGSSDTSEKAVIERLTSRKWYRFTPGEPTLVAKFLKNGKLGSLNRTTSFTEWSYRDGILTLRNPAGGEMEFIPVHDDVFAAPEGAPHAKHVWVSPGI